MKHAKLGVSMAVMVAMGCAASMAVMAEDKTDSTPPPRIERKVIVEIRDKDGMVDKSEARGPLKEHFDEIDTNKDGKLTHGEIIAFHEKHGMPDWGPHECRMIFVKQDKDGKSDEGKEANKPPRRDLMPFMGDKDGDGKISRDEFLKRQGAFFDQLDANKDGFLTPDERPGPPPGGRGCPPAGDMPPPPPQ